jgi:hypothetical protein
MTRTLTESLRLDARILLMEQISQALHQARRAALNPDDVVDILTTASHSLIDLDAKLQRERALLVNEEEARER